MSSIFGKCAAYGKPVSKGEVEHTLSVMNHWGANETHLWTEGNAGMGHLALWDTPENKSNNLLYHPEWNACITADARLDNRAELYQLLQLQGMQAAGMSDSQLILLLYKKYGEQCPAYLLGDFAFAIWDAGEQKLFCARDHMGVKPLFYYHSSDFFAFATEKKGLLCLPGVDKTTDKQFICNLLFSSILQGAEATLYAHIKRLHAAHTITYNARNGTIAKRQYWTLDPNKEHPTASRSTFVEGLRHHMEQAVSCRLHSLYPVGAQLSGGLDSSAITGIASSYLKRAGSNIYTYTNTENALDPTTKNLKLKSERRYADAVIDFNNIKDSIIITNGIWETYEEELAFSLAMNDGVEKWNLIWEAPMFHAANSQGVRTMLSGFPGDQLITYRGQFYFMDMLDKGQYLKYFTAKSERTFHRYKPFISSKTEFYLHKLKNLQQSKNKELLLALDYFGIPKNYSTSQGDVAWEDQNYRERYKSYRHYQKYRILKPQTALRMDIETRMGLHYKVAPRYPMADIRLLQYYLAIPNHLKYEGERDRNLFREAVAPYLPGLVLNRDKKEGGVAPFMVTDTEFLKRKEAFLNLLQRSKSNHPYIKCLKQNYHGAHYNQTPFIEILSWHENNFEK